MAALTAAEISAGEDGLSNARSLLTFETAIRTSDFWADSVFLVAMGQSYWITSVVAQRETRNAAPHQAFN